MLGAVTAESTYSVLAKKVDLPTAKRIERLELAGHRRGPRQPAHLPAGELAAQVIGAVGAENEGLTGLEDGEESVLQRHRRRTADRHRRQRRTDPARNHPAKPRTAKTSS